MSNLNGLFSFVNAIPFLGNVEPVYIKTFSNKVRNTVIRCWLKNSPPEPPVPFEFDQNFNGKLPIPVIKEKSELIHTHLEVRVMNKEESECLIRFLVWNGPADQGIQVAVPNDKRRDIDAIARDLMHTRRRIAANIDPLDLSIHYVSDEYYIKVNSDAYYPLDCMYN